MCVSVCFEERERARAHVIHMKLCAESAQNGGEKLAIVAHPLALYVPFRIDFCVVVAAASSAVVGRPPHCFGFIPKHRGGQATKKSALGIVCDRRGNNRIS